MRVSFEWLREFVSVTASPEETADRLTMAGLEIEGIEHSGEDVVFAVSDTPHRQDMVFEVNVTPNRPDCLSICGIARELAAAFDLPLRLPETAISGKLPVSDIRVEIDDTVLCNRYTGRIIRGVKICSTPEWIRQRLEKCGIRALNNNVVDITNYVLLEFGHPLHAFDADRLFGNTIRVAKAGIKRKVRTLDNADREVPDDALLIWDGQEPVAVAGIMGGEGTSVNASTQNIFIESAYFEPTSIRRTSKALGLKSESSFRFERGTDIEFLVSALNRAAILIAETGGGTIHELVDVYPVPYVAPIIPVQSSRVNALLGTSIEKKEMEDILRRVGLRVEEGESGTFTVSPPAYRRDIKAPVDVVEEVARIYGFSRIPVQVPAAALSDGRVNKKEKMLETIKDSIRKCGFSEVINYSFMNPADLDLIELPAEDRRRRHLEVKNPLRQEDSLMRTTLVASLLQNFLYNVSRGAKDIRLFELSRIFIDEGEQLPSEELRLGGIFYREDRPALWKENAPSFFVAKGALDSLFDEMKIQDISYVPSQEVFLHKGKSADIVCEDHRIGFVGEFSPSVVESLDLKISAPEIVIFELDLDAVLGRISLRSTFVSIPRYPSIERDIAIILDEEISAAAVMNFLHCFQSDVVADLELFDHYKGKNIPEGKKSLAFRIVYRAKDRTLTDEEVDLIHSSLLEYVLTKTGGELRE